MGAGVTLTKTRSGLPKLEDGLRLLSGERVLVGIPSDENARKAKKGEKAPINNAALLFILSKGSQLRNLPATPVIEPAINEPDNKDRINRFLKEAAQAELEGRHGDALECLQKAGMAGANAAKRWFTDPRNGWPPNADSTINRKLGKLSTAKREAALDRIVAQKGDTTGVVTRNIDTGQLRRAITYVVEENGDALDSNEEAQAESDAEGEQMADGVNETAETIGKAESAVGEAATGLEEAASDVGGAVLEGGEFLIL